MRFTPTTVAFLALLTPSFGNVLMCYFGSWAGYRTGNGTFNPEDIDPTLCTHIIYAFVGITADGAVDVLDPWNDLPDDGGKNGFAKFVALKERSPSTKALVGIGGWNQGSLNFSAVVNNSTIRSTFVKNAVTFLETYDFDGLDVDWEYPAQRGGIESDVVNFINLLAELKEAFEEKGFILTAAVAAAEVSASQSYDIPNVSKYLDFINVMTYDLHGSWDSTVGINAPLYPASYETTATELQLNVDACINYWLDSGADASKIVLGMPLYGRTFTLTNSSNNTPGSAASGPGTAGQYTQEAGTIGYNELCERQIDQGNWTTVWFEEQQVPYTYSGDQWVGYDNEKSIAIKTNYAIEMGLAGVMFWSVETDDFKPVCGDVKFPLIKSAHDILFPTSEDSNTEQEEEEEEEGGEEGEEPASTSIITATPTSATEAITASSTSSSTSTTASTTTSSGFITSNTICTDNGYVRDEEDCSRFWQCVALISGEFVGYLLTCPGELLFDNTLNVCNWPRAVDCSS